MAKKRARQEGEPRRRRRRRPIWQKIVLAGFALIFAFFAYRITIKLVQPVALLCTMRKETHQLAAESDKLKNDNEALQEKRKYLLSREGAETEARKLGYVRRGEISIIIQDEKKPQAKKH